MSHLRNNYTFDRQLWRDGGSNRTTNECVPWLFRENSITLGTVAVTLAQDVLQMLALFDVFSLSAIHDQAGVGAAKGPYYSMLRTQIAEQLTNTPGRDIWNIVPDSMSPWLWRVSLGFFNHDDTDEVKIKELMIVHLITVHSDWTDCWEDWKMDYGDAVMPGVIHASQVAGRLYNTEGFFEGWQHDQFCCWDQLAQWKGSKEICKSPVQFLFVACTHSENNRSQIPKEYLELCIPSPELDLSFKSRD
jgi:hypothetical protein